MSYKIINGIVFTDFNFDNENLFFNEDREESKRIQREIDRYMRSGFAALPKLDIRIRSEVKR